MTTNEDILLAITELTGEVRVTTALLSQHVESCARDRGEHNARLTDHDDRLRGVEVNIQGHQAAHRQTRLLGGALAAVVGGATAVVGAIRGYF